MPWTLEVAKSECVVTENGLKCTGSSLMQIRQIGESFVCVSDPACKIDGRFYDGTNGGIASGIHAQTNAAGETVGAIVHIDGNLLDDVVLSHHLIDSDFPTTIKSSDGAVVSVDEWRGTTGSILIANCESGGRLQLTSNYLSGVPDHVIVTARGLKTTASVTGVVSKRVSIEASENGSVTCNINGARRIDCVVPSNATANVHVDGMFDGRPTEVNILCDTWCNTEVRLTPSCRLNIICAESDTIRVFCNRETKENATVRCLRGAYVVFVVDGMEFHEYGIRENDKKRKKSFARTKAGILCNVLPPVYQGGQRRTMTGGTQTNTMILNADGTITCTQVNEGVTYADMNE